MKIIEKNDSSKTGPLAVILLAAGVVLLCWSLWMLPSKPAVGFPWEFALAVASFLPIGAGGWMLNAIVLRHRDPSYKYGGDGHNCSGGIVVFALLVIIAGAMLIGFNSGVLLHEWKRVFFSWQMLLLVVAMNKYARRHFTSASVLLVVGGFFIIRRLASLYPDIAASGVDETFWPMLLIIAGVLILGGILFRPSRGGWYENCRHGHCNHKRKDGDHTENRASGVINIEIIFGGCEQVYLDPVFRGGKIATIFGGVKLDLRRTALPEGETWLTVETVFGGVDIDAPEEWVIEIRNESVFGGFYDKRLPAMGPAQTDGRKLIIRASNVFGGGEIK